MDRFNFTEEGFDSTHAAESTPAKKKKIYVAFVTDVRCMHYFYTSPSISTVGVSFIRDSKEAPCV